MPIEATHYDQPAVAGSWLHVYGSALSNLDFVLTTDNEQCQVQESSDTDIYVYLDPSFSGQKQLQFQSRDSEIAVLAVDIAPAGDGTAPGEEPYPAAPELSYVDPQSYTSGEAVRLTLYGSGLSGVEQVLLSGDPQSYQINGDNEIVVDLTDSQAGPKELVVTSAAGTSAPLYVEAQ